MSNRYPSTALERFEDKYIPEPMSGCWLWLGAIGDRGYGRFFFEGKNATASRVTWTLNRGRIPNGLQALHRCDNRLCVNPDHLFLGTNQDNMADKIAKGRQMGIDKTHCLRGHPLSGDNIEKGYKQRRCLACRRLRARVEYKSRQREDAV